MFYKKNYTYDFKEGAVKQVVDKGHAIHGLRCRATAKFKVGLSLSSLPYSHRK
jgi:hypothetical protein